MITTTEPSTRAIAEEYLRHAADMPVISLGMAPGTACEVVAILGGGHIGQSMKEVLGLGMQILAEDLGILAAGQDIIESSSGSAMVGAANGAKILRRRLIAVTDINVPAISRKKAELLGAELIVVDQPHPTLGWQQAREDRVREERLKAPSLYYLDQNNNPLNPAAYERWLMPVMRTKIDPNKFTDAVFGVGSGGHLTAFGRWFESAGVGLRLHAADRVGSITFGGEAIPSVIRGVGNTNVIPRVIGDNMRLVNNVVRVSDAEAIAACRHLAQHGLFVGGSSGLAYAAALRVAQERKHGAVLTLFPDRGELYANTIFNDDWIRSNGFSNP